MTKWDSCQTQKKQHEGQQEQQVLANLKKQRLLTAKEAVGRLQGSTASAVHQPWAQRTQKGFVEWPLSAVQGLVRSCEFMV